jgi:hypothetical protein
MKSNIEKKDSKKETDFFDWWDSFESRVNPMERMPTSMDEQTGKAPSRA